MQLGHLKIHNLDHTAKCHNSVCLKIFFFKSFTSCFLYFMPNMGLTLKGRETSTLFALLHTVSNTVSHTISHTISHTVFSLTCLARLPCSLTYFSSLLSFFTLLSYPFFLSFFPSFLPLLSFLSFPSFPLSPCLLPSLFLSPLFAVF